MNINQEEIYILIKKCKSNQIKEQIFALEMFVKFKIYSAVPVILELLKSDHEIIRFSTAEALSYLGKKELKSVGLALINLLTDPAELVRSQAVDSLGILNYKPARKKIELLLINDPSPLVRASAAETIGDLGDFNSLNCLQLAMKDWDTAVRGYTANSLGIIGKKELIPQLQIYINSEDSFEVKAELLVAQYRLGKAESLNDLLSLLAKADEDLAIVILNIFDDLLERKTPLITNTNIVDICQVLKLIEQKFLILAPHSKNLIIKCEKINYF